MGAHKPTRLSPVARDGRGIGIVASDYAKKSHVDIQGISHWPVIVAPQLRNTRDPVFTMTKRASLPNKSSAA